ncbi:MULTISPECIES: APC family permease [unclassified Pseudomonas]|uniref:APC family permease n=1 Tax=unclassified Pseudomonas TaxID=196821 RepID=UPI001F2D6319|nr:MULTISPECIES: APC family permease [unclassified Pseudomonas]MCF5232058.1 amino acid permease [Pseudomonas sp. PA-5-4H]MCF5238688.1 amino acid permease [Pseudomonas sp. PA-5-4G]MCF5251209.1 amino acid permease [Pseudomonas sp. PA-5-4B]MCF5256969.1 amino acid permease [Pseudomonas sp. PA-5-4B]MCF5259046.1 amino acid permease [Pseudomonas sp. PA-5-4A]
MSESTKISSSNLTAAGANPQLSKKFGLLTMMSICIGLVVAQGAMISTAQGVGFGAMTFLAAMVAALAISQCNAMSFAELSLMFPQKGTLATYTQKALGHVPAIVAVFAGYIVVSVLAVPVEMFMIDVIVSKLLPGFVPTKSISLLILVGLTITNLMGADVFARVQNLLVVVMVSAIALVSCVAITGTAQPHPELAGTPVDWSFASVTNFGFIGFIALSMWCFVGIEYICSLIGEVKDPHKNVPRSMHLSLFVIFLLFVGFGYGITFYMDSETLVSAKMPYVDFIMAVFGSSAGLVITAVVALTATSSSVNTVLAAVPRMMHGMAEQNQLLPIFKKVNRYNVPWVATVVLSISIVIPYLSLDIDSIILFVIAASTSYLIAYLIAHLNVIVLRKRMPDHPRPYRSPFFPLPQIFAIVAILYVAINNSPSPALTSSVYAITGGMLSFITICSVIWVKFYMKRGIFEPDMD